MVGGGSEQARDGLTVFVGVDGTRLLRWARWEKQFPWLSAGFSTRHGGVSEAPWDGLNCGLHVGDSGEAVIENRRRIAETAGFRLGQWTCAEQVHGCSVAVVSAADAGAGRLTRADALDAKDALITDAPGVMLAAYYADCVPLWFVDPLHKAVGLAHAGWRGSALDVAGETIRAMEQAFGSSPAELRAAIGPSIRGCCYEVDRVVAEHFFAIDDGEDTPDWLLPSVRPGRYMLDLVKFNRQNLTKAGILAKHIEISEYCTSCRTDLFFSHRKEKGRTGRMAAWIARKAES